MTSLLAEDVEWTPQQPARVLRHDRRGDRPSRCIWSANLLDMSRLTSGALSVHHTSVGVDEIVPAALASLGDRARHGRVAANIPETLPARSTPTRPCSSVPSPTSSTTRSRGHPTTSASASRPGQSRRRSTFASSTADRASRWRIGSECSNPSSGSVIGSNGAGVGLGLAVAQGSSRSSVATSTSRTRQAAAPRWS